METIIVQDTDHSVLDALTVVLEEEGYQVYSTISCDDVLKNIDLVRPHVVMLDIRLSSTECLDVCVLIKTKYPNLPVIALSCNNNINTVYSQHGFDDYIEKPFELAHLYAILRKHIPPALPPEVMPEILL